jgi:hypothetical protein
MHGSAELMVDRFNRGAGACAGPRSTTVREINAEAHHNPPTSMRSLFRFPLRRRAAASFNKPDAVNPAMALWFAIKDQGRRVTDLKRSA